MIIFARIRNQAAEITSAGPRNSARENIRGFANSDAAAPAIKQTTMRVARVDRLGVKTSQSHRNPQNIDAARLAFRKDQPCRLYLAINPAPRRRRVITNCLLQAFGVRSIE